MKLFAFICILLGGFILANPVMAASCGGPAHVHDEVKEAAEAVAVAAEGAEEAAGQAAEAAEEAVDTAVEAVDEAAE